MFTGQVKTNQSGSWKGRDGCSDRAIEAHVRSDLRESGHEAIRQVECRLHDGVMTLSGQVHSYYVKQLAQEVARRSLSGAARIRNTLTVVASAWSDGRGAEIEAKAIKNQAE